VPFTEEHASDVLLVIGSTFAEYGMVFEPSGYDADLLDIRRHYLDAGGWFVVLVDDGRVVGTAGARPGPTATCEIKRVYLLPEYRGRGHGRALVEHLVDKAGEAGCREIVAWSDVRLVTAHRVYERLGFERFGERTTDDIEHSREYGFRKALVPG
jgi:GNAT superfamily N-acetyltransferase